VRRGVAWRVLIGLLADSVVGHSGRDRDAEQDFDGDLVGAHGSGVEVPVREAGDYAFVEARVGRLKDMERFELAVGLEVGLDDNESANVRGDQRGRKLRESLVLRKGRCEWDAGMCHARIAGGALLEAPARVRAEPGEVEVDGVDGATCEDAVVADGAAAATVGEDGHAVGAARVVGVDVSRSGFRA